MNLLLDNPVLQREIRGRLRYRKLGSNNAQAWTAGIVSVVIVYFYGRGLIGIWRGTPRDATELWSLLVYGLLTLIVLLAPALSSTAITTEREQQTWESLALTRLTAGQIIVGKWIARQFIPLMLILIALPFLLGCEIVGDISIGGFLATLFFLLVTTNFFSMIGLLCSFRAKRTMIATASAFTVTALLCIGTVMMQGMFSAFVTHSDANSLLSINPFWALTALLQLNMPENYYNRNTGDDTTIITAYLFIVTITTALGMVYMTHGYRNTIRGG